MKIVVTGSLGHISKPLAKELISKGHEVTIISSNTNRRQAIEAMGAIAAIGTMQDSTFLTETFRGADVVYVMETLGHNAFFDPNIDVAASITQIGANYKQAIELSGVKKIVHLSSIGAHTGEGNGMLRFHYNVEQLFKELPAEVSIKTMRPVGFYYNMFAFIPTIKQQHAIFANYGGDEREPWVSTDDIAAAIAEEIEKPFDGRSIRYIASDEASPNELVKILGTAIGMPDLKWLELGDDEILKGMIAAGMNLQTAKGLMEMNAARRGGKLYEDYYKHRPALGKTKLTDFAKYFAGAFNQKQ